MTCDKSDISTNFRGLGSESNDLHTKPHSLDVACMACVGAWQTKGKDQLVASTAKSRTYDEEPLSGGFDRRWLILLLRTMILSY